MGQLLKQFNAHEYDPTQSAGQLPVGRHPVVITRSEVKPTKDGGNGLVEFELTVIDGPDKGRSGAYRLNLYHQTASTAEIAHRQLSALCHVTGQFNINATEQLHNIPFVIDVAPQSDPKYTEVKKVYDMQGNEPGKPRSGGGAQAQPAQQQTTTQQGGGWGAGQAGNQGQGQQQGNDQASNQQAGNNGQGNQGGGWGQQAPAGGQGQQQGNDQASNQQAGNNGQGNQGGGWGAGGGNGQAGGGTPWGR